MTDANRIRDLPLNTEVGVAVVEPEWHVTLQIDVSEMSNSNLKKLFQAEDLLREIGVHFDTGYGFGKRDWELDGSLKGATTKVHQATECKLEADDGFTETSRTSQT